MPLHKFGKSDILHNQIKTYPSSTFFIYDSSIYYNNNAVEPGQNVANVNDVPVGHVSMFELNVDQGSKCRCYGSHRAIKFSPSRRSVGPARTQFKRKRHRLYLSVRRKRRPASWIPRYDSRHLTKMTTRPETY